MHASCILANLGHTIGAVQYYILICVRDSQTQNENGSSAQEFWGLAPTQVDPRVTLGVLSKVVGKRMLLELQGVVARNNWVSSNLVSLLGPT